MCNDFLDESEVQRDDTNQILFSIDTGSRKCIEIGASQSPLLAAEVSDVARSSTRGSCQPPTSRQSKCS